MNDDYGRKPQKDRLLPTEDIKKARLLAGLTQEGAGLVVNRTWHAWRAYENGANPMDAAVWELFLLKTGLTTETIDAAEIDNLKKRRRINRQREL